MNASKKGIVSWLHVSDLHACMPRTGWDSRRILKTLVEDLKKVSEKYSLRPDLVFFTGDLAFGQIGSKPGERISDQFDKGAEFLEAVRTSFSPEIRKDALFIV